MRHNVTEVSMILSSIVFCINDLIYLISNKKTVIIFHQQEYTEIHQP